MSSLYQFGVSNNVPVVDNNFSETYWSPYIENNWDCNLPQKTQNFQQILHSVQQTQQPYQKFNTQPEEPYPVYDNLIEDVAATVTVGYQESNSNFVPCTNYNQTENLQNILQNPFLAPCDQIHKKNSHLGPYSTPTNYVNTKADIKAIKKRKRKRTMFTTEQVAVLEKVFLSKPYINRDERRALVEELQINDRVIKVWFQNRRLKEKREAEEAEQELCSPDAGATETKYQFDVLSYVESQINKTDKFGFVTLDDKAMNGLASVIDNLLPKEAILNLLEETRDSAVTNTVKEDSESSSIYEPISPPSSDYNSSEASTSYEPFEPQESLQRIFDIQEFLIFNKKTV